MAEADLKELVKELLEGCKGMLEAFDEWAGPPETEVNVAARARNRKVRAYIAARAAAGKAKKALKEN